MAGKRSVAVLPGLEVLARRRFAPLRGLRVGLVCNPTAVDRRLRHAADVLSAAPGVRLSALFGPEHGVRGDVQYMAAVGDERDRVTGLPVHSLYGSSPESLRPGRSQLAGLDALVFDVLDRPNPSGSREVEGPAMRPGFQSFCGMHDLAVRHGMTVGELAALFREERGLELDLEVVPCEGWRRRRRFPGTGLPWVLPSPNMPTPDAALVYPGMCLLEGTNLSEGRGTTRPFHLLGAPWLDAERLAADLDAERLPGVRFRPARFTPTWDKHEGKLCHGVELHLRDAEAFRPV